MPIQITLPLATVPSTWFGTGEDYLLNDAKMYSAEWTNYLVGTFSSSHFNTVRLAFSSEDVGESSEASTLNLTQMATVLNLLGNRSVRVILDCHSGVFNNTVWWNTWQTLATTYKNDSRVLAYELINEPPASNITGNPVKIWNVYNRSDILHALNLITTWIRTVDTSHYIVYDAGYIPVFSAPSANMVLNFHFWDYGNLASKEQIAIQVAARIEQVNSWDGNGYSYWLGEVGPHTFQDGGCADTDLEKYYVEKMINAFMDINVGFSFWLYRINHHMTSSGITYDSILQNSNYFSLLEKRVSLR
jgi:hypothetical protein